MTVIRQTDFTNNFIKNSIVYPLPRYSQKSLQCIRNRYNILVTNYSIGFDNRKPKPIQYRKMITNRRAIEHYCEMEK